MKRRDMQVNTIARKSNLALIAIVSTVVLMLIGIVGGNTALAAQRSTQNITQICSGLLPMRMETRVSSRLTRLRGR